MADSKPVTLDVKKEAAESARIGAEQPVGKMIVSTRESRGLSRKDVTRDAHIPEYYIKMIESDDYSLIADQLYLLPFLRRYAEFLGLDAEEIAIRFVRDVQRADVVAARMLKPIPMVEKKPWSRRRRPILIAAVVVVALVVTGLLVHRSHLRSLKKNAAVESSHIVRVPLSPPSSAPAPSAVAATAPAIGTNVAPAHRPATAPHDASPARTTP